MLGRNGNGKEEEEEEEEEEEKEKIFFLKKYCFVNKTITAREGVQGICEEIFFMTIIQNFFD